MKTQKGSVKRSISKSTPVKNKKPQKGRSTKNAILDENRGPKNFGYARVSTEDQNAELQTDALLKSGVDLHDLFVDQGLSGTFADRPALQEVLSRLKPGDTLTVWKLDRLGRSLLHLMTIAEKFKTEKIYFKSLTEGIDTQTVAGRLLYAILGAVASFEKEILIERTRAGMASAKRRGTHVGRPRALAGQRLDAARDMLREGRSKREVARFFQVSVDTVSRYAGAVSEEVRVRPKLLR